MDPRKTVTVATLGLLLTAGCAATESKAAGNNTTTGPAHSPKAKSNGPTVTPTPSPTPEPAPKTDAAGTYKHSCDYVLGNFTSNTPKGYRFVADAQLKNTGNVGTVTEVKAVWYLSGGANVTRSKKVRLPVGKSRRVGFTVPVSQDQIDLHQALTSGQTCNVKATMVNTFGKPTA